MPSRSYQQQLGDDSKKIYFRKCCKHNEIYDYNNDKCVEHDGGDSDMSRKQYPINFVHDDFSA